ncbi:hypothetical protein RMATCC62417_04474 [Rhizopus microsporus]|nr:hypothetical protein RMATCC62417_04474 [Rhizopus microsporus]
MKFYAITPTVCSAPSAIRVSQISSFALMCPEAAISRDSTSPLSEEEESYPKAPTMPSSDVHFDVLSSSPTNFNMLPEREDQEIKKGPEHNNYRNYL